MKVNLDDAERKKFLREGRTKLLRLAVVDSKNRPHISSVWYLWDGRNFWVSTSEDRLKAKLVRENPNVALIVDTDVFPYEGIIVEGVATLTKRNVSRMTLEIVKRYITRRYVKSQFQSLMKSKRILMRIRPLKAIDIMSYEDR
ncbi:MAG: pyridoxamine 5'-phosphate oxidase family protein [Nitrososphaerales archaeon]